ncbi:outer membrane beta-barrel family protein [Prevotella copri]|uniref:outer membrane beta-barrel family protein n=1 Tax=Segatella copri TaxID=165179 RepID=UPI001C2BA1E7|nr:outer membrane beta-barrel family protein [Segatella copri]MBU9908863.1 outer membrane beta-barrel family protein [Segatella copri]MBV3374323.1 outer membrane beta-barrel family protein [Segatella copri]
MKALLVIIMSLCLHVTYAQKPDTTKTFIQGKELGEVVVKSSYLTREGDHILAIPTKEQRKHAVTGYDLLSNLMIPGVSVERSTGSVTTPNGAATLYIDGREVDFREVQSLRPKDVSRVEYFDVPTGKFAKDAYAINIIMKPLNNGGYTQLDASQNVGYLYGDYNLISKFVTGTKSLNLWAGYSLENPKSSMDENETFIFPDYQLNRLQHYNNADNRQTEEYVQASISNRGRKYIWMLRGGMAWNASKNGVNNGMTEYWKTAAAIKNGSILDINTRNKSYRPSVYFYGLHTFSNTKSLDYVFDGYYSRNDFDRLYNDDNVSFRSLVKEDYYYIKANANYSMAFSHRNRLAFSLYEFMRISDSEYVGTSAYNQNLHSSETILFADYSHRLGSFFFDINPGLSFLTYRLKGMRSINHLTPRLQARATYRIDKVQQLQFMFALGNTYPRINTINNVEQQIDPIIILKGNSNMDNSILLNPRLSHTLNLNKFALQTGVSYFYQNHSIISDYYIRDGHLISTFRDDCIYHRPSADMSITYKPSGTLNMKLSGQWIEHLVRGGAEHRNLSAILGTALMNYYVRDFSFSASIASPARDLIDSQISRKTFWRYHLSAMWNHGNWAIEANANNLFMMKNNIVDELSASYYSFKQIDQSRSYNQYANLKIVYSFDYGKKTSKSPDYKHQNSESAILK